MAKIQGNGGEKRMARLSPPDVTGESVWLGFAEKLSSEKCDFTVLPPKIWREHNTLSHRSAHGSAVMASSQPVWSDVVCSKLYRQPN
jgi:hypothetical protein